MQAAEPRELTHFGPRSSETAKYWNSTGSGLEVESTHESSEGRHTNIPQTHETQKIEVFSFSWVCGILLCDRGEHTKIPQTHEKNVRISSSIKEEIRTLSNFVESSKILRYDRFLIDFE